MIAAIKNQATGHYILNGKGEEVKSRSFIDLGVEWHYIIEDEVETLHTDGPLHDPVVVLVIITPSLLLLVLPFSNILFAWKWALWKNQVSLFFSLFSHHFYLAFCVELIWLESDFQASKMTWQHSNETQFALCSLRGWRAKTAFCFVSIVIFRASWLHTAVICHQNVSGKEVKVETIWTAQHSASRQEDIRQQKHFCIKLLLWFWKIWY